MRPFPHWIGTPLVRLLLGSVLLIVAALSPASAQQPAFLTNGLVAYYPFDGSGADASSMNQGGSHAFGRPINYGGDRFGRITNSSYISGEDVFQVGRFRGLDSSSLTVSLWFKPANSGSQDAYLISKDRDSGPFDPYRQWAVFYYSDGSGNFSIRSEMWLLDQGKTNKFQTGLFSVKPNAWNHLSLRWSGLNLYLNINGDLKIILSAAGNWPNSDEALRVGANNGLIHSFDGLIDDVRVYNGGVKVFL